MRSPSGRGLGPQRAAMIALSNAEVVLDVPQHAVHDLDPEGTLRPVLSDIELRLLALSGGDELLLDLLRRRLISKLSCAERRAAAKRRAIHAKKFVAQRGRCAACGLTLSGACVRRGRVLPTEAPLRCTACGRDHAG
jgi:hypothetical protein